MRAYEQTVRLLYLRSASLLGLVLGDSSTNAPHLQSSVLLLLNLLS